MAAHRAGVSADVLTRRPDLLRFGGRRLEEVYFAFQFDEHGVRPDVGRVVQTLKATSDDVDIADWLVRPNRELGLSRPLDHLTCGGSAEHVIAVARTAGPRPRPTEVAVATPGSQPAAPRARRAERRRLRPRHSPAWHSG
mgnify:CR=1 FL=1